MNTTSLFDVFDGTVPIDILTEITALSKECNINEYYDLACDLVYIWKVNEKIVAVIAFKRCKFQDGRIIPRFEHIFYSEEVRSTKKAYAFILSAMRDLKEKGHQQCWAYVKPNKKYMEDYALKFGFNVFNSDLEGKYLYKDL